MAHYNTVLLDIEGTTTPISFVHDKLFPYVCENVQRFLEEHWEDPALQEHVNAICAQANKDINDGVVQAVAIEDGLDGATRRSRVVANVMWQMDTDRKIGALKGLQGYMWKFGYESGELKGVMYADAIDAIKRWSSNGKRIYIYSSGSVEAQKLIFGYTDYGNLLEYISGHYDTNIGPKLVAESYTKIAQDIGTECNKILFISDNVKEIQAADKAGMQTIVSIRPGNAPVNDNVYKTTTDFMNIPLN